MKLRPNNNNNDNLNLYSAFQETQGFSDQLVFEQFL